MNDLDLHKYNGKINKFVMDFAGTGAGARLFVCSSNRTPGNNVTIYFFNNQFNKSIFCNGMRWFGKSQGINRILSKLIYIEKSESYFIFSPLLHRSLSNEQTEVIFKFT